MKKKSNNSLGLEKEFFNRLFKEKEVSMVDFMDKIGLLHKRYGPSYLDSLIGLWSVGGNLIQAREKSTGKLYDQFSKAIASPQDYYLVVQDIEEAENDIADKAYWQTVPNSETIIDEGLVAVEVRALESVQIIGDEDEGLLMYERIRAFTQLITARLLRHDFAGIETFLHSSWGRKGGVAGLEDRFRQLEDEHGGFEYVDNITVFSVYAGDGSDAKVFDEMKLPKGVEREQRRGSSVFNLISRVSPNGMPMLHATAFMEVVAEGGEFKILNLELRSNL